MPNIYDENGLVHYKDIKEYGVYQPLSAEGHDLPHLKLVCVTHGVRVGSDGNMVPDEEFGIARFLVSENYKWVLAAEGAVAGAVGYVNIKYRKLEHIEAFVGLRLKE